MDHLITIVVAIISSGVLSTLITVLSNSLRDRKAKDDDIRAGVRMSLYFLFRDHALYAIRDGEIDPDELKVLADTYETYKRLGGDGYCDRLMETVNSLTIVKRG